MKFGGVVMTEIARARSVLYNLDPTCSREDWVRFAMAAKAAGLSFEDFHNWSKNGDNYKNEKDCRTVWESIDELGGITEATLFYSAREKGWKDPTTRNASTANSNSRNINARKGKASQKLYSETTNTYALEIWKRCVDAEATHEYILRKQGKPDGLRVYPASAPPLIICGQNIAGYLVIPCWSDGNLQTLQFIPPKEGTKLNFPGVPFNDGYFMVGDVNENTKIIYLCESIGVAWSVTSATGCCAVVCFGAGRMKTVAKMLRSEFPNANLVVVPDRGKEKQAAEIAATVDGQWVKLPQDKPENYDVNDYLLEYGEDALCDLLSHPIIEMPLNVIFASELSDDFIPPDEILEGVLTAGDGSILYGDSNCGKTFFVIDLACAVALGIDWLGRKTEAGLVIYLAAESPASVRSRLQAYQRYHNVRVTNFAIVQSPINLFDGDADTKKLIQVVRLLEQQCGQKARLIIGDTLARLSAGANENAGQDMGLVVRHFDCIRTECNAHFMLIHHSGKNAAAGARGWSGVRAAVDTEIEVTDTPSVRCAEITKQRDLNTKGIRIGFQLETVTLGLTKWKSPATSCVVVPAEAPAKSTSRRLSEIGGAVAEYLSSLDKPVKKRELVRHFKSRYESYAIYRELKKLVKLGQVIDCMGFVNKVPIGAN